MNRRPWNPLNTYTACHSHRVQMLGPRIDQQSASPCCCACSHLISEAQIEFYALFKTCLVLKLTETHLSVDRWLQVSQPSVTAKPCALTSQASCADKQPTTSTLHAVLYRALAAAVTTHAVLPAADGGCTGAAPGGACDADMQVTPLLIPVRSTSALIVLCHMIHG
jgi:hypothetical protein